MGSYRSEPELTKHTYQMGSVDHSYAVTHMCGWRKYMEDASMIISPFTHRNYSLFGIFDGHGGPQVALFVQKHFPQYLQFNQNFKAGKFEEALKETFLNLDRIIMSVEGLKELIQIRKNQVAKNNSSEDGAITRIGSTCLVVLVTKQHIYIANAGDCRAIIGYYSGAWKQATKDHKPQDYDQQARILKAGGVVQFGRVNGVLNLSRALGDLEFKNNNSFRLQQQMITSLPDVVKIERNDLYFIFLCCDGVWECKSSQQLADYVRKNLNQHRNLGKIMQNLFDESVAKQYKDPSGTDNMSAILIKFDKTTNKNL